MKVFISSLITGYEPFREAAKSAVLTLGHTPVMAEDFAAQANSSQIACLRGIRESDLVVLILVERYGSIQPGSGKSPTHEEYDEARGAKPMVVFVREGLDREQAQTKFLAEVQSWDAGHHRKAFKSPEQLRDLVLMALHRHELAVAVAPVDVAALAAEAEALLPKARRDGYSSSVGPMLSLALSGGPRRKILRPAELEDEALANDALKQALFGDRPIFQRTKASDVGLEGDVLAWTQEGGARAQLSESGAIAISLPLRRDSAQGRAHGGFDAVIEEVVVERLSAAILFADWMLERVDPSQRLTHVAVAASVEAGEHVGWRTQAEQDAGGAMTMSFSGRQERAPVGIDCPRAALRFDAIRIAEDLMVPLRRQRKPSRG